MYEGRRVLVTVAVWCVLAAGGGPALAAADGAAADGAVDAPAASGGATPGPAGPAGRMVDVGGGRGIRLECRGSGSPTVVLVSGTGGASDEWTSVADPARPAAAPKPGAGSVLATVASFTRVCAYDRPGTTRFDGGLAPSTPVAQPTTAADGVRDLRAALAAGGERPPYVLVGASWGAMIAELFARTDFPRVAGLVTVDGASPYLRDTLTPAQWSDWMKKIAAMDTGRGLEVPDYEASVAQIRRAPALPRPLPATVLTSDRPWDLGVGNSGSTWPAWLAAQDRLARELHARHVTDTGSGHGIAVERPRLVADAVREVVDRARGGG
ncbi:alpha/beta fold hydrolase [Streptomyces goshikiensis]|uniref:alpha/beta fold hydrolase n=1 Tax=Streptomyces goshikiensis TaxID=1942 RepID=UPI00365FBD1D